jgi:hypothetical protein
VLAIDYKDGVAAAALAAHGTELPCNKGNTATDCVPGALVPYGVYFSMLFDCQGLCCQSVVYD